MTKLPLALVFAFSFLSVAQTPASVKGNWKVTASIAGNESSSKCAFTQTGTDLSGVCKGEQGSVKITGKVTGTELSWSYGSDYNGTALTMNYKGKLVDGKITGQVTVDPFGVSGDFTATPEK